MRYVVAMVFAVIGAVLAAVFASPQVADWVVLHQSFESPDGADSMHMLIYMACNVAGLLIGWLVGWTVGGSTGAGKSAT